MTFARRLDWAALLRTVFGDDETPHRPAYP
jgi:hypothetical protein